MTPDLIISLGGISTEPGTKSTPISAVDYSSSVLDNSIIVNLVPSNLIDADRATAELAGLRQETTEPIGHTAAQTLAFPAWAVINDPDHASLALSFIPELDKAEALAATKPNKAKARFIEMAGRLEEEAPQQLPTFYEQAARIFLKHDSATNAANMFTRAREAERTHNLTVDPQRHTEAFVEFALAGAVTAKEWSNEAPAVSDRMEPREVLDFFTGLIIQQMRAGISPYAGLPKDLKKLPQRQAWIMTRSRPRFSSRLCPVPAIATSR